MSMQDSRTERPGPVGPSMDAPISLRPLALGDAKITRGFWSDRLETNRNASIPAGLQHLEDAGNLENFRRAARGCKGGFRGRVFNDSDVYKWLEALAWEQGREPSDQFAQWQREISTLIARAQAPDGYLNTHFQLGFEAPDRYTDLGFGHELYCIGHLIQAAVAQARTTSDADLLPVAMRAADHVHATFGPDRRAGVPGHPVIEMALVELFRLTSKPDYLETSSYFIGARGQNLLGQGRFGAAYYQDHVPVRQARMMEGHAVRALFLAAGVADLYTETGDPDLLESLLAQWTDMVSSKTYVTGGLGSRWKDEAFGDPFELPSDRAYCETCAAHASILLSWRLLLVTGEPRFADLIERTLYNAFLAGVSLDGDRYFYSNPLQIRTGAHTMAPRSASHGRQPWYETACCPPNVMRTLSSLGHYLATKDEEGVQIHQYTSSEVETSLGTESVRLGVETNYPWDGEVELSILRSGSAPWTLSLRIPSWAGRVVLAVNGVEADKPVHAGRYVRLHRQWEEGDTVRLHIPMQLRATVADHRIDALRGSVALERGPLVYCLEQSDQAPGVSVDELSVDPASIRERPVDTALSGVTALELEGRHRRLAAPADGLPYTDAESSSARTDSVTDTRIVAVPYFSWGNRGIGPMRTWVTREPRS